MYMIRIRPNNDVYVPCQARVFSGIKTVTYPTIFKGVAIVGYPEHRNGGFPNVTANQLVHKSLLTQLFGDAYLFKVASTINDLQPFTEEEVEAVIMACIANVSAPMSYTPDEKQEYIQSLEGALR